MAYDNRRDGVCPGCGDHAERGLCPKCYELAKSAKALLKSPGYPRYFDAEGHSCRDYVDSVANQIALAFASSRPVLTKHQLRAFFGHLKKQEAALRHGLPTEQVICEVARLKAHAQARFGRDQKIPEEFKHFIDRNVDAVRDEATLAAFVKHFEAVTAFFEGRLRDKEH